MPAGTDLIFFNNPGDWQTIVNTSRRATIINEKSHAPIPAFDLGVSLNANYIAVVAGTTQGEPSWWFAGDITQTYSFSPGGGNPVLGKVQTPRTRLAINRLQVIEANRISTGNYRLRYTPPSWFKDCTIRVYKYTGDRLNFVEDSLFDIGNALGIDPANPNGLLALGLASLRDDIDNNFQELNQRLDESDSIGDEDYEEIQVQLNQLNEGIYTLAEGLANLLPPEQSEVLIRDTQQRLNSDLGLL